MPLGLGHRWGLILKEATMATLHGHTLISQPVLFLPEDLLRTARSDRVCIFFHTATRRLPSRCQSRAPTPNHDHPLRPNGQQAGPDAARAILRDAQDGRALRA